MNYSQNSDEGKVYWNAQWNVLKNNGVGGQLQDGIKTLYNEVSACQN